MNAPTTMLVHITATILMAATFAHAIMVTYWVVMDKTVLVCQFSKFSLNVLSDYRY